MGELEDYFMPRTIAVTYRLQREFKTIGMAENENPLLFLGRVDKAANELAMLGSGKKLLFGGSLPPHSCHSLT